MNTSPHLSIASILASIQKKVAFVVFLLVSKITESNRATRREINIIKIKILLFYWLKNVEYFDLEFHIDFLFKKLG